MLISQRQCKRIIEEEENKPYFEELIERLLREEQDYRIVPSKNKWFACFNEVDFGEIKVVILGQDPYPGTGQANGFAFSVDSGQKIPSSLKNIYKELSTDLGYDIPSHGNLNKWAIQGVLLLNTVLTTKEGEGNGHQNYGWETFTDNIIQRLGSREKELVFILWGESAKSKERLISNENHLIIKSSHPSRRSVYRSFWGSKPFSRANIFLEEHGQEKIDWQIE